MKVLAISFLLILFAALLGLAETQEIEAAQTPVASRVQLVESNAQRVVLELVTPALNKSERIANGITFLELSANGAGRTDLVGKPQLPIFGVLVAVPQQAKINVNLTQDRTSKQTLANPVLPAGRARVVQPSPEELPQFQGYDYIPDTATYNSSAFFPAETFSTTPPANWRSQRYIRVQLNPFQYNPVTRELITHEKMRVEIDFGLGVNAAAERLGESVNEGGFEQILKQSLVNYDSARAWRTTRTRVPQLPRTERAATTGVSFKISVNADGIYKVTCDSLIAAGLDANNVNLDTLKLAFQGNEVAVDVVENGNKKCESGEYFLFFGQAPGDYAIPNNVYWLSSDAGNGKRIPPKNQSGGSIPSSYLKTLHLEQNAAYYTYAPFIELADHWVWKAANASPTASTNVTATLNDLSFGTSAGTLRVLLQSGAQANPYGIMQSTLYSNDVQVNQQNWTSGTTLVATANVNNLTSGLNTFKIQDLSYASTGILVFLNYLELDYPAQFIASSNQLRFKYSDNGLWNYPITGFTNSDLVAYDITDPANLSKLNISATLNSGTFTGAFSDQVNSAREYFVLATSQFSTPLSVVQDTPSTLTDVSNGADYIIITYGATAWKNRIAPLAAQRATMGRVMVIDVEDIYDEFYYGMKSAQAIRNFLEYAYANWQSPKPSYVLLVGNGNMDNGNGEQTYIPVYMKLVDPWIGMTSSDHCYVALDSPREDCQLNRPNRNPLPSMAIGRLPALSAADVQNMVTKILDYENNTPTGAWRRRVMFISDNGYGSNGVMDPAGDFFAFSEEVAGDSYFFPSPMIADRVYYNPCNGNTYPQCALPFDSYSTEALAQTAVKDGIAAGRLVVNYVGHGAVTAYAHNLLRASDAPNLTRADGDPKYPFLMPMTCFDGYFHSGFSTSVGEAMVRQAQGGAIGDFAPTGLGVASGHDYLDRGFFEAILKNSKPRVGLATVASKSFLLANGGGGHYDLLDTFNLLGDPGTMMALSSEFMPTSTPSPTPTFTPSNTPTPTNTFTPTNTPTSTNTPTNTLTPTATNTATFTPTFTSTPTNTPTSTATFTPSLTPTPTHTWDPTGPTWTPTFTPSNTPTFTPTYTPTNTPTYTPTDIPTSTPTYTPTDTPTDIPTDTPTDTPTDIPTDTPTYTPTPTEIPPPECTDKPSVPPLLAPERGKSFAKQRVTLKWDSVECATQYRVIVRIDSKQGAKVQKGAVQELQLKTRKLERDHTYFWRIKACNEYGCRASPWRTFSIRPR